ncbi:MAG: hypothetical protein ABSH20_26120 [Tepidisphaeraceae bacterium]
MRTLPHTLAATLLLLSLTARGADAPASRPAIYDRIVQEYMSGKWDDLDQDLKASVAEINALPAALKLDVTYIRQTVAECRPLWWKQCKAGQKTPIRSSLWGRNLDLTFDPAGKGGVQVEFIGARRFVTVSWPTAEMDNPDHAEHGYSKGELNNLSISATLGMAQYWAILPLDSIANLNEQQNLLLNRCFDLRGNITGVYYGSPRARQWGFWLYMAGYMEKYQKMPTVNGRKAVGALFVNEVVANSQKYPSIKLPNTLDADGAEEKLALKLKDWIEKRQWTLAEDRLLRDAAKTFAMANEGVLKQGGIVTFANKLVMSLDPAADGALRGKRDAWVKAKFDEAKK